MLVKTALRLIFFYDESICFYVGWMLWRFWRGCECRVGCKMLKPYFQVSMWQGLWSAYICKQLLL